MGVVQQVWPVAEQTAACLQAGPACEHLLLLLLLSGFITPESCLQAARHLPTVQECLPDIIDLILGWAMDPAFPTAAKCALLPSTARLTSILCCYLQATGCSCLGATPLYCCSADDS